jgi:hypothetical protein
MQSLLNPSVSIYIFEYFVFFCFGVKEEEKVEKLAFFLPKTAVVYGGQDHPFGSTFSNRGRVFLIKRFFSGQRSRVSVVGSAV